jgi:hypothetical protein
MKYLKLYENIDWNNWDNDGIMKKKILNSFLI